ncbi:uncharacterized protein LOC121265917 [Juglans microcarpa x Juglans regia]|uniref:uncharacterized protein LOC121265917 n=1 Tax=Juglans microcarpa x Juglans regia TaxID=2249226 RepID=UPI001B7DE475|nr:uncharacterized protein LOC121265917 [Juglans microcarpa x Juglans regia]
MNQLLTALKIFYVLDPNPKPISNPTPENIESITAERKKREEDELVCRGHILNTFSDHLYDLFTTIKSPKEIYNALEEKYKTEKLCTDKFIILKYFEFKMVDNLSVLDQVHELQVLVNKLRDLSISIPKSFQAGAIIAKLPPSWNNYRKKLMRMAEELTLEQIRKHLQIEEQSIIRDENHFDSEVKVNSIQEGDDRKQNYLKTKKGNTFKKNYSTNKDKKNKPCLNCGKKGHYIHADS